MAVSHTSLEPSSLSALGISSPTFSADNASFLTSSTFIWMLFFSAIVLAALYEYVLVGVYRMQASESGIRKSNETFRRTTLGLFGVFGLFLIIFTLNKAILTGEVGLTDLRTKGVTTPANPGTNPSNVPTPAVTPPTPAAGAPVGSGVLATRIYNSAMASKDTLFTANAPGTNNGRLACAYAVNEVLKNAGIQSIDRLGNLSVRSMESGLQNGRGTLINQADARKGDIVIEAGTAHVGICIEDGCSGPRSVISNSSGRQCFCWPSGPDFKPSYQNGMGRFYRVNN